MIQSQQLDERAFATLNFDSAAHGWQALLLRQLTYLPEYEDASIPAVRDQTITMVLSGETDVASGIDGRWRWARTRPGTISMTAPGQPARLRWQARTRDPLQSVAVYVPVTCTNRLIAEVWDRDPDQVCFPDTLAMADPVLEHTIVGLLRAAEDGFPDSYAEAAVDFLIVHTLLRHGNLPPVPELGAEVLRIRKAKMFLRENLHRPVALAEVAQEVGLSRYHFQRTFLRQSGETPNRYLNRLRIEQACHALVAGSASVTAIASRCGFTNPSYFSLVFRRATGSTPLAYRRLHRPEPRSLD